MSTASEKEDVSGNEMEFAFPETVLCVDTICRICYAEFLHEEDLKLHMTQQHKSGHTISKCCQFCSYIYTNLDEYTSHIINVHILDLKPCKYCLRVFTNSQHVKTHEKKHFNCNLTFELSCANCKLTFKNLTSLQYHEYSRHSDIKDGVLLTDSYSLLSSYLNMNAPIFLKTIGENVDYKCVCCNFTTSDVDYYIQHLELKNCRSLVCDKCCHVFKDMINLKKHLKANTCGDDDSKLPCKKCLKLFTYEQIQEHTKCCNAVKCYSCDATFDSIKQRSDHQTEYHPMMFSIKECRYCRQEYVGQDALDKHIKRTHNKNLHLYKYFCIYCDDTIFDHPKKLFNHFFRKHRDLEPFTCKICSKTFRLRKNFTLHIKLSHLSIGNVKFDDKYHVIFERNSITNQNKSVTDKKLIETVDNDSKLTQEVKQSQNNVKVQCQNDKDETDTKMEKISKVNEKIMEVDSEVHLVLCPTDKETDQEVKECKKTMKRRRKMRIKDVSEFIDLTIDGSDSDNEPLIMKRRRARTRVDGVKFPKWLERSKQQRRNREKFTCKMCKKYCYTYQNYQHHITLHKNNQTKKCIKCPKVFKTNEKLNQHVTKQHSTSKLTETLKNVLERRKQTNNYPTEIKPTYIERQYMSEKFAKTIKKVNINASNTTVKIKPVIDKLSVRKFIENFTPESNGINCKGNTIYINNSLTIKPIMAPKKPPIIKIIKSKVNQLVFTKLKQPERFKTKNKEKYEISIKIADPEDKPKMNFNQTVENITELSLDDEFNNTLDTDIPGVAEEVLLQETVEMKPNDPQNVPNILEYKGYRFAHLTTQAPYYKIVKLKDVVTDKKDNVQGKQIKLPNGSKLVNVNPLAHLLVGKQIDLKTNKYYKPKLVDIEKAVASALFKSKRSPKARKPKKNKVANEQ